MKPELPAVRDDGLRLEMAGTGGSLTVKVRTLEVPPPGPGEKTVTLAIPAAAISEAGIVALNRVEDTKVVV